MNVTCNHCHKEQEAFVTKDPPHRVICKHCGEKIEGISPFTVRSLVDRKRFDNEDKGGFSFYCEKCNGVHKGILQKESDEKWVKCSSCGTKMDNVSDFMIRQMSGITLTDEKK